jgi:hypothetical protein
MALDEFTDGDGELTLEETDIEFRPYNAELEEGTQTIYSAAAMIQGQLVVVELEDEIERSIMEQGDNTTINKKVAQQLAKDHIWNRLNHKTVMVEDGEHEQVIDDDTDLLDILHELYHQRLTTRTNLEDRRGAQIRHDQMKRLEDKKLVSHVGKDGRAHLYTVTPRGVAELMSHEDTEKLRYMKSDGGKNGEDNEANNDKQSSLDDTL